MLKSEIINHSPAIQLPHMMAMPGGAWFPLDDPDAERIVTDIAIKAGMLGPDVPFYVQIADSPFCVKCVGGITMGPEARGEMAELSANLKTAIGKARPMFGPDEAAYFDEFLASMDQDAD